MENSIRSFVGSMATVALIVVVTRWLIRVKGAELPKIHASTSTYGVKVAWRVTGLASIIFSFVLLIAMSKNFHTWTDILLIGSVTLIILGGLSVATGSVITDGVQVSKRELWGSRSLRWCDITEIRLHAKDGGAIELRAGLQKLVIDSRFVAFDHLLSEIKDRTQLQPIRKD